MAIIRVALLLLLSRHPELRVLDRFVDALVVRPDTGASFSERGESDVQYIAIIVGALITLTLIGKLLWVLLAG